VEGPAARADRLRGGKPDPGDWAPSAKAYVDGLVDAGLLPDDNSAHPSGPYPEIGPPVPTGDTRMPLVMVEVTAGFF